MHVRKRRPRVDPGLSRLFDTERTVARNLTQDFTIENSQSKTIIERIFNHSYDKISKDNLKDLANVIGDITGRKAPRNYCRTKTLLFKYFDDNLDEIIKRFNNIILIYE